MYEILIAKFALSVRVNMPANGAGRVPIRTKAQAPATTPKMSSKFNCFLNTGTKLPIIIWSTAAAHWGGRVFAHISLSAKFLLATQQLFSHTKNGIFHEYRIITFSSSILQLFSAKRSFTTLALPWNNALLPRQFVVLWIFLISRARGRSCSWSVPCSFKCGQSFSSWQTETGLRASSGDRQTPRGYGRPLNVTARRWREIERMANYLIRCSSANKWTCVFASLNE